MAPKVRTLRLEGAMMLESGVVLPQVDVTFTTYGELDRTQDNVVWILHPLTCNANPLDWWASAVGPGRAIDPAECFVVCVNALGSCYGTTGPTSLDPATGKRYGRGFPMVTVRDVVAVHDAVRKHLGVARIRLGLGGSFGGQQLLEWMASAPGLFDYAGVIGATAQQSPWATAWNETQRMALQADATFVADSPGGGVAGLAAARAMAVMTYRSAAAYARAQGEGDSRPFDGLKASGYQRHLGASFVRRYDPHAYWTMTKAMDSHDVARGRGAVGPALAPVTTRTLMIGLADDLLFPCTEVAATAAALPFGEFLVIESDHGHDSILTRAEEIAGAVARFACLSGDSHKHGTSEATMEQYA
ncbi:homoserine O-acetyltransferase [Luteibacter aegosomatis]|uniref:homoserine O-acetyltransferase family protein n=1 Tax=Luteibacter aegosomatis TaxID=2911537 RepID=UPI001FFBD976|nr:homoserine O-acetyltransferase [Luteibacter aegosomatis]UPG85806.1 homoserine O-acetyltransferase [Luteibacter aegosomatis]